MTRYVIFYDEDCGLCDMCMRFVLKRDLEKRFLFASLTGKTAEKELFKDYLALDSLILLEDTQIFIRSRAIFRLLWLLGGFYTIFGVLVSADLMLFWQFIYRKKSSQQEVNSLT